MSRASNWSWPAWSWPVWFWLGIALAVTGLHLVHATGSVGEWSYLAVGIGVSVAAWIGAVRVAPDRTIGALVALGVTLSATGDLTYQLLVWFGSSEPDVSVADIAWLGNYVAISAALVRMLQLSRDSRGALRDALVDVGVIAVLALLVEWEVAGSALASDHSVPAFTRVVWGLYPAFDALLIALVLRMMVTHQRLRGMQVALAGGALFWLASDFTYLATSASGALSVWQDTGWLLGAILLASAIWQRPVRFGHGRRSGARWAWAASRSVCCRCSCPGRSQRWEPSRATARTPTCCSQEAPCSSPLPSYALPD